MSLSAQSTLLAHPAQLCTEVKVSDLKKKWSFLDWSQWLLALSAQSARCHVSPARPVSAIRVSLVPPVPCPPSAPSSFWSLFSNGIFLLNQIKIAPLSRHWPSPCICSSLWPIYWYLHPLLFLIGFSTRLDEILSHLVTQNLPWVDTELLSSNDQKNNW